ncbi:SLBB domain-containing protein [Candidatus Kapabacteria bacterium]|nr:SLBB domain-containing protein [Candidatus Kapabacteria bacterium]
MKNLLLLILVLILPQGIFSQNKFYQNKTLTGAENYFEIDTLALKTARENSKESFGLIEKVIDPGSYIIGPGDGFIVMINSFEPVELKLEVDPVGEILIPSVGKVDVKNVTLDNAIELIEKKIKETYEGSEIYISLSKIKKFKVRVSGLVGKSQIVTATSMDRVSEAIDRCGGLEFNASVRNILLIREFKDTVYNVDLDEFYYLTKDESNPYLMGGDHIIVSKEKEELGILISGEIYSKEIIIEYSEGDSLSNLLRLSKGFTPFSKLDSVEYYKYDSDTFSYKKSYMNLTSWKGLMKKPYTKYPNDIEVFPGDRIYIRQQREIEEENYATITGEVIFPGRYTISKNDTWLSDLINNSGGINEDGSFKSAYFIRQEFIEKRDEELERLKEKDLSEMSESEQKYYQVRIRENRGSMVVDFEKAVENPKSKDDILLTAKDSIHIPLKKNFVNIQGKVVQPGIIKYKEGFTYLDYIFMAGGFTSKADKNETFIRKSTGEQFLASQKNYVIQPGDLILVPQEPDTDFWDSFFKWFTFITQLITVISVIVTVSN